MIAQGNALGMKIHTLSSPERAAFIELIMRPFRAEDIHWLATQGVALG
jgi:hypothetical protein